MAFKSMNASVETWNVSSASYKAGKRKLEEWHEACRRKRIEAAIDKKKKELALKRVREYQDCLINKVNPA